MRQDKEAMKLKEEYIAREKEAMEKIEVVRKIILKKPLEKDWVSPLDFYPELKDRARSPYTGLTGDKPVWLLLPYFANIIVGIPSYLSEQEFKDRYGLDINQLLQLQKDGKVSLILMLHPTEKISDYLLPLYEEGLKKHFPTSLRMGVFVVLVGRSAYERGWEEGEKLFRGKLKKIAEECHKPWESVTYVERMLEDESSVSYACLKWFGYDQICLRIKALARSNIPDLVSLASVAAYIYGTFLVDPTIRSFDGIHLVDEDDVSDLRFVIKCGLPPIKAECEVFPFEIGRSLIKEAKLVVPSNLDGALDYYKDFESARRALRELEMAVYEKKWEKLIDRARALEEVWREVKSIDARAERASEVIATLGAVFGHTIGATLGGLPGFLAGLFGDLVSKNFISRPLGERVSKIGKSGHIVFVYDFVKSARKSRGD